MARSTELWLVRHGETEWSRSGAHTSRTDIALTDYGRKQASALGPALSEVSFDAVLTSPMQRARETCAIAGLANQAKVDENLREWDYGDFEGKTTKEIRERIPDWSVWRDPISGGEPIEKVGDRADAVIARALEAPGGEASSKVALFAHAHILRILTARWLDLAPEMGRHFALSTGSLSILGWEREERVISHWNRDFAVPKD